MVYVYKGIDHMYGILLALFWYIQVIYTHIHKESLQLYIYGEAVPDTERIYNM